MGSLFGDVSALLQSNPWLAVVAVFLGGMTTALNPCVLAMIPLLMGVVAGNKETTSLKRSLAYSRSSSSWVWPLPSPCSASSRL